MRPRRGAPGGRPAPSATGRTRGPLSLARALSKFGVCSRKKAARWIESGRVAVNGAVVRWPGRRIDPHRDRVSVDGSAVGDDTERIVLALHKPVGLITSRVDPGGRATIYDLLGGLGRWVFPVGRLDRDTSGLLILTNDHRLGQRLSDPEQGVAKTYHALVDGIPDGAAVQALREGVPLPGDARSRPAGVRVLGASRAGTWLEIVLTEGKNRQVRRMCSAVGHEVLELARVRIGGLALEGLPAGEWRRLDGDEILSLAVARTVSDGRPARRSPSRATPRRP
jgi:23S rRNA pseudouridine2605 synthase